MKIPTGLRVMRVLRIAPSSLEIGCPGKLPAVPGSWTILMIVPGPCKFEDCILNWPEIQAQGHPLEVVNIAATLRICVRFPPSSHGRKGKL